MKNMYELITNAHPDLIKRECGGWLAVSSRNVPIRVGVTASTKEDVVTQYLLSIIRWADLLYKPDGKKKI